MATQTTTTRNGTQQGNDALSVLLQELLNGGTQDMQRQSAARQGEVNANQALRARYSPEAALADSQGLMSQNLRRAMESSIPTITRSAEGAGASANSMRALLTQDALTRAAESSSALGVNAVQGYGQLGVNLSGVLEALTRSDSTGIDAIMAAIQLMQSQNQEVTSEGAGGGGGSSGGTRSGGGSYSSQAPANDFFNRPGGILSNAAIQRNTAPQVFGPTQTDSAIVDKIVAGLGPSQSLAGVPNINALYRNSYTF